MTGETPVVDVQSARQTTVINGDVVRELPASRSYGNYLAAIPAIQATGFNTGVQTSNNFFTARGGRSNEGAIQIEGLIVGSPFNGGGVSNYLYDMNNAAEVQVSISGGLGESDRGAPIFNIIPKTGGNTFSGNYFGSFAGQWGQSSNIDESLRALGFADAPALRKNWDNNISVGGPIKKDKLWFFANWRTIGSHIDTQNLYANKNAGNPNEWRWVRDESVRVRNASARMVNSIRLTSQVTPRNKVGFFIDYTKNCTGSSFTKDADQCRTPGDDWTASGPGIGPGVATTSPESGTVWQAPLKIVAGHVEFTDYEPRAVRGRRVVVLGAVGRRETRRRALGLHLGHRAVHQRRRADGQLHLPRVVRPAVAGPAARHLARHARVRVRQPQPEGRLSGGLDGGEDHHPGRPADQLHLQQRLADPVAAAGRTDCASATASATAPSTSRTRGRAAA